MNNCSKKDNQTKILFKITTTIFFVIFSFLLLGCTEMSREERNICYALTTQSYDYITNCRTEQECYREVSKLFDTKLGNEQESKLYEIKNNYGRSWFYYNRGINELEKITRACEAGNIQELPGLINQTRFYLQEAFREMDKGIKNSFEIITLSEQIMTIEKIDLLKEEEAYYTLVEMRQILSDLETGNTKNNNYVSYYLERVENYNQKVSSGDYIYLIEKDSFWIQAYKSIEDSLLSQIGLGREKEFPFMNNYFIETFSSLENIFFKTESISELRRLPANEFMKLYSDLSGARNSALKRFAELINKNSKSMESINKRIPESWNNVINLETKCENLIIEIEKNKKFVFLEQELLQSDTITQKIDYEKMFEEKRIEIKNLREKKSRNNLGIGEELNELKRIENFLKSMAKNLELKKEQNIVLLKEKCLQEAQKIRNQKFEVERRELDLLKQDLLFFSGNVMKKDNKILHYCEQMIKTKNDLIKGIKDFEKLETQKINNTYYCFEFLENTLKYTNEFELIRLFENLKRKEVTQENIFYFEEACNSIRRQLENALKDDFFMKKITENFEKIMNEYEITKKINYYLQEKDTLKKVEEFGEKIINFEKYYNDKKLEYALVLPKKDFLLEETQKILEEIKRYNDQQKIRVIQETITKKIISHTLIETNVENELIVKIIISNPFDEIIGKQTLITKLTEGEMIRKGKEVENIIFGENAFILMSSIPTGETIIEIKKIKIIEKIEEDKIIYATNNSGLIQRSIKIDTEEINRLIIKTQKPDNFLKAVVFLDKKEISHNIGNDEIIFVGENVDSKTEINVFMYTEKLIELRRELKNETFLDLKDKKIEYLITAKNLTDKKIKGTIIIPLNSERLITRTNIYDELMTNKHHSIINNELVLKNQDFLEREEKKYQLVLMVESVEDYYREELERILEKLLKNNEKTISSEIEKVLGISFNKNLIKTYEELIEKGNNKLGEIEKQQKLNIEKSLALERLLKKIEEMKNEIEQAKKLGLEEIATKMERILEEVVFEKNKGNIEKALLIISKIEYSVNEEILEQAKRIYEKTRNYGLEEIENSIREKYEKIESIISYDPILAKKMFESLKELEIIFLEQKKQIENEKTKMLEIKEKEFLEMIEESKNNIYILEKQMSFDREKILELKIVFPITNNRLEQLKRIVYGFSEYNEKDYLRLEEISNELKIATDEIKRRVIREYNTAIDIGKNKNVLAEAKKAIDSNEYIHAIFLLNQEGTDGINFVGVIPIIMIIIVGVILKNNFYKKKKEDDKLKKKILEEWDS